MIENRLRSGTLDKSELFAAIVFLDFNGTTRERRSVHPYVEAENDYIDAALVIPRKLRYKIRMASDSVPRTDVIFDRFTLFSSFCILLVARSAEA